MNYLHLSVRDHENAWNNAKIWHPSNPDFLLESNLLNIDYIYQWMKFAYTPKTLKQLLK